MNIFQLLGLPADHRKEAKVTQLVKHFDEVTAKNKVNKRYAIQLKEDGVCAITIIRDGVATIFSRTGRKFTNTFNLCYDISAFGLRDGVYFGEMVCDLVSLEVLSGATNPNRVKALTHKDAGYVVLRNLRMRFFDLVSIESFIEGASQTPFQTRYNNLVERIGASKRTDTVSVINLVPVIDEEQIDAFLNHLVSQDEEGLVVIDLDADWVAGHKGWRKMKKVRGCDYDLLCIGYEDGKGKSKGLVANLFFRWKDGKTIKCSLGKGWTHQMAREMFEAAQMCDNVVTRCKHTCDSSPVLKVFQVYALEESSKGKLRLPKVGEQRHDKLIADV